ncbi:MULTISPECIES: capsule biosynthesis GfcC family protein [Vibrio]|uniref:capsule biosynthesis GfcC family protein n=1 Tax=Vibrio TaxID=662 RepID=UPI00142EEE4C|nr:MULTISPECIES: capsule biosynthesis GfcC family protein [Vibrio]
MKFLNKMIISVGVLGSILGNAFSGELTVELPISGATYNYEKPSRLEHVLNDVNMSGLGSYFSLAAQLFALNEDGTIEAHKEKVFRQLSIYSASNPDARFLLKQLKDQKFSYRVFIDLNRNVVISQLQHNPQLSGHFALYLKERPQFVELFGAIKDSHQLPVIEGGQLTDYLNQLPQGEVTKSANPSLAYVIQPDGQVIEVPYAYWNFTPRYFAPGAILFIAFDSLPSEFSTLNQDVIELLRHKVNL